LSKHASTDQALTIDQILAMAPSFLLEAPQWSPDGQQIAFLAGLKGAFELWGVSPRGGFPVRLTVGLGEVRFLGLRHAKWSPDGQWIAYISEKTGAAEVWLWSRASGVSRQLTQLGAHINALSWAPDGSALVYSSNRHGAFDVFRVEVPDGHTSRLTRDSLNQVYPVFAPDGQHIIYVRLNERWTDHEVTAIPASGGRERIIVRDEDLFDYHYGKTFGYPLVSPDGKTLLFRSHRSGYLNYWQVPMGGGEPWQLCAEDADQSEAAWAPDGRAVAYISNRNGTLSLCIVPTGGGAARTLVGSEVGACALPQWSPDGRSISYLYQSPTQPLDLWVVSVEDGSVRQLTDSMLGGEAKQRLLMPQKVAYDSFDGRTIHGYLYADPSARQGKKLPGLLWIHGGPTSQWFDAFYPHLQYFAQQGYAVLAPNIRGSSGYGKEFEDLNNRDWGHDDLKDALAGVEYLKSLDHVDADKMGITGTSYGGCLSMSAVCFAPGVFQAAIPMSGYADWVHMHEEQELRHIKLLEYEFGPRETSEDVYRRCSPIYSAKQATTPTFVLHGEGRLPRSEASRNFAHALEKEYKVVQYKAYPNECYYVRSLPGTRQMWLDMRGFLERYL
jgi:dipeptidyl aminopeptidase/acylaminoacyl peptidase